MTGKCYIKYAISFCLNIRRYAVYVDVSHTHIIQSECVRMRYKILYFIRPNTRGRYSSSVMNLTRVIVSRLTMAEVNYAPNFLYDTASATSDTSSSVKNFLIHTICVFQNMSPTIGGFNENHYLLFEFRYVQCIITFICFFFSIALF